LTSCLTGLDKSKKIVSSHTADSKPVKQEVYSTVILPPSVFSD
jgi:(2Fe-2S) ferredoxin